MYSDDRRFDSTSQELLETFREALKSRFDVFFQGNATRYLQAAITQDEHGSIYLDQKRYAASIVQRYITNAVTSAPSVNDLEKYASPLPTDFKWSKEYNLTKDHDLKEVETDFGFRLIEVAGSFNYLAHKAVVETFVVRKMCLFTRCPGHKHFKAITHLLHNFICRPPRASVFHVNHEDFALVKEWYPRTGLQDMILPTLTHHRETMMMVNRWLLVLSKWELYRFLILHSRSCYYCPQRTELNELAVATTASKHIRMIMMWFLHGDISSQYIVSIF